MKVCKIPRSLDLGQEVSCHAAAKMLGLALHSKTEVYDES